MKLNWNGIVHNVVLATYYAKIIQFMSAQSAGAYCYATKFVQMIISTHPIYSYSIILTALCYIIHTYINILTVAPLESKNCTTCE